MLLVLACLGLAGCGEPRFQHCGATFMGAAWSEPGLYAQLEGLPAVGTWQPSLGRLRDDGLRTVSLRLAPGTDESVRGPAIVGFELGRDARIDMRYVGEVPEATLRASFLSFMANVTHLSPDGFEAEWQELSAHRVTDGPVVHGRDGAGRDIELQSHAATAGVIDRLRLDALEQRLALRPDGGQTVGASVAYAPGWTWEWSLPTWTLGFSPQMRVDSHDRVEVLPGWQWDSQSAMRDDIQTRMAEVGLVMTFQDFRPHAVVC